MSVCLCVCLAHINVQRTSGPDTETVSPVRTFVQDVVQDAQDVVQDVTGDVLALEFGLQDVRSNYKKYIYT